MELPLFNFSTIAKATANFSLENKIGEGGFGQVYKVTKVCDCIKSSKNNNTQNCMLRLITYNNKKYNPWSIRIPLVQKEKDEIHLHCSYGFLHVE